MRVAIVADTHLPSRVQTMPDWIEDLLSGADRTIHAGDFDTPQAHFDVAVMAGGELTAVVGNMDARLGLPRVATLDAGDVRFAVTHGDGHGTAAAYRRHLVEMARARDADIAVGGHTHRVLDEVIDGIRVLNPGSATGADPASAPTAMMVDCDAGDCTVTVHHDSPS